MRTLERLHPRYAHDVHTFVQSDPARLYRLRLDLARLQAGGLPTILAVLHDRAGGTLRHVRELARHLAAQAQFLTLTPAPGASVLLRMATEGEGFELAFRLADQFDDLLQLLRTLGVGHVHYHHLLGHSTQIRELAALLGVTYDFTAHDYYSYCTHISLTGNSGHLVTEPAPGQCGCCPPSMAEPLFGTVAQWRGANAELLTGARHVFAPSHDCARRIAAFAPAAKVLTAPHTDITPGALLPEPRPAPLQGARPLKIVVIGALSVIKGADVLEAVALEAAKRNAPLELHLLGYCYRHLQTQPRARLTVHGEYQDEDLPGLLQWLQPDAVWFPAQWPETYSYTLSAVLQAGLPVVVPDIGAFAERIAGRPWSWVCPWDETPAAWVHFFNHIRLQNFITGLAPSQPRPIHAPIPTPHWQYHHNYLAGLPQRLPPAPSTLPSIHNLSEYLAPLTPTTVIRSRTVGALAYLRVMPVLRHAAQAIPAHWQRKVKNWLLK